jgi:exonuclease VII small subunit
MKEGLNEFTAENVTEEISKIKVIFDKTELDLESIINLCEEGLKLCKVSEVEINELLKARNKITTEYLNTFQKFLMHVVQSVHLVYEMQYAIEQRNPLEWYTLVGDISNICLESLLQAKKKIYKLSGVELE